ncbi:glycerol transporter [Malassezia yamatoensis]|uniref:Glycerol transporter n=1 Tax=Malassezia yamatoensis TaxID=253288 RepID=A0AAJ6CK26_9BASI|nr:glycerol transporter [Malassezia yamatoensis]
MPSASQQGLTQGVDQRLLEPMELELTEESKSLWQRRGITLLTVDPYVTEGPEAPKIASVSATPRWFTKEFYVYYVAFVLVVPYMIYVPIRLSSPLENPNYARYANRLVPGWINNRLRDNSDYQYRAFRDYLPAIFAFMCIYVLCASAARGTTHLLQCSASQTRTIRKGFLGLMCFVCAFALHGTNALKLGILASLNYRLTLMSKSLSPSAAQIVIWTFNGASLVLVFWLRGIPYGRISPSLAWMDNYAGLWPRWYINYNFSMLRFVSFAFDYLWSNAETHTTSARELAPGVLDSRSRVRQHRPLREYGYAEYLLYIFYPPLFIAGPIMTFNDFSAQLVRPLPIRMSRVMMYALRCAILLFAMELILHYMYVNAIKNTHAWTNNTPMELSMIGFWNLMFVWLKLLLPWRIFRLWALFDQIDPPENMIRAMFNNYSALGFWRSWHRSYNLWVVRYIYVPVGGSNNMLPAFLLVFTFVALWHDLSLTLLAWAWLVTLFVAPELLTRYLLPSKQWGQRAWYRHVCALGGAFNVLLMMTANLVGFVVGVDGVKYLWLQLVSNQDGIAFMVITLASLFIGVQLMYVVYYKLTQV